MKNSPPFPKSGVEVDSLRNAFHVPKSEAKMWMDEIASPSLPKIHCQLKFNQMPLNISSVFQDVKEKEASALLMQSR